MRPALKTWIDSGAPFIWLNAGAVALSMIMVLGLLLLIAVEGLGHFWPSQLEEFDYVESDGTAQRVLGERVDSELVPRAVLGESDTRVPASVPLVERELFKVGNRDLTGIDFRWVVVPAKEGSHEPDDAAVFERREWGNFYGYPLAIRDGESPLDPGAGLWESVSEAIADSNRIHDEIEHIEKSLIGAVNYRIERSRLAERRAELDGRLTPELRAELDAGRAVLQRDYDGLTARLGELYQQMNRYTLVLRTADGATTEIPAGKVVNAWQPNRMNVLEKCAFYLGKAWEFAATDPREANTEGGIFPAIFGTVLMVMVMAIIVTPFGVVAAVYLREYARQGFFTRLIRIAVNNLAGVPSIVYGVFGLGFFVYFLGGQIDRLFYAEALPAPTFGTPGLLWASLTLALLTVPVVIVATEEGLSRVPREIREGSLALGATKAETLWRTVLPMTASAMMTGMILAVARAAGEVAPLMLVGVVKLAPSLPLDGNFPFLHLDRKFMHLGFHIYDVGFQSPNVEAARPLVYATSLLLVAIIVILNLTAITIRNRLREKYRAAEQN
jgi:phosphate transport system permease protein